MRHVRLGCGAGYSGDRLEPAVELAERGNIAYLVFECLAERTMALANLAKLRDPDKGYDPGLQVRMRAVLPFSQSRGLKIITNMGGANPALAGHIVCQVAEELGLHGLRVAVVLGDDILEDVRAGSKMLLPEGCVGSLGETLVSANVYLGSDPILEALQQKADVVITGRVADPSLFLAPMRFELGWAAGDWGLMGAGIIVGHLLECCSQVMGGYFADPPLKQVPDLANLGFPIAEVYEDGHAVITKLQGSGGFVTLPTCKEQLVYEVHDPSAYLTPDCTADFTNTQLEMVGPDLVTVRGGWGRQWPDTLKVSLGVLEGYIGEGEISYAGSSAYERANLAGEIVRKRLKVVGAEIEELRIDLIGINSLHGSDSPRPAALPYEVRLRVAARTQSRAQAELIGDEVENLYLNGPSAGGGARKYVRQVIGIQPAFVPREVVRTQVSVEEAK
jgi:hypothetical protein